MPPTAAAPVGYMQPADGGGSQHCCNGCQLLLNNITVFGVKSSMEKVLSVLIGM
jgi:hypothetical protein